jgi:hypothetical protein
VSPHLTFVPTPSQKTAVTGSENGGYMSGEEESDANHFTQFLSELSGHDQMFEHKDFVKFDFFRSKSSSMQFPNTNDECTTNNSSSINHNHDFEN